MNLESRIRFLRSQCGQYGTVPTHSSLLAVIQLESRVLSHWELPYNNRTLPILYSTPFHDMLQSELAYFGLAAGATAPCAQLLRYRAVNMGLLSLDSMDLHDYRSFIHHVAEQLERDVQEAHSDAVHSGEDFMEMRHAQVLWSGRTRQFECECMSVEVCKCTDCGEVSLQTAGAWTGRCVMCRTRSWASPTEDISSELDARADTGACQQDSSTVHMYGSANGATPPSSLPGSSSLTDSEQAMLSPILPYIRITNQSGTSRGRSYGHTFIAPQTIQELVYHLPRLPSEIQYATITDAANTQVTWDVNIPRVVQFMHTMSCDRVLSSVLGRHGVCLDGQDCAARLQEWQQGTVRVPRVRRFTDDDTNWSMSCAPGQFAAEDDDEDEAGPEVHWADRLGGPSVGNNGDQPQLYSTADGDGFASGVCDTLAYAIRNVNGSNVADIQSHIRQEGRVSDSHPDFFNLCFPYLNFGCSDFYYSLWGRETAFNSKARWLRHILLSDGRFAAHKMFAFIGQNWVQRAVVNSSAAVFLRRNSDAAARSMQDLQEDIEQGDFSLSRDIFLWAKAITGSVPYWRQVRSRVSDLCQWKWFATVPSNERYLHPNFSGFPDIPGDEDLDLDLTPEELLLVSSDVPESMVMKAAASERAWSRDDDDHEEDTEKALALFLCATSDLQDLLLSQNDWSAWSLHTAHSSLKWRIYDTTLSMEDRAKAALQLCRFRFVQDLTMYEPGSVPTVLDYFAEEDHQVPDCLLEPFLGTTFAPECDTSTVTGAYQQHQFHFAQHFRERSGQFVSSCNPSFFFTGSMAEMHWPDLWRVMLKFVKMQDGLGDEWLRQVQRDGFDKSKDRVQALHRYPHISTAFFRKRTELFFDIVLKTILGIDDYVLRYEFADGRGEIHWHALLWSARFPLGASVERGDLDGIVSFARVWLRLSSVHPSADMSRHRFDEHSNPEGDKRDWHGQSHPCKQLYMCLKATAVQEWDIRMCNCCFHHACCKNDYCLRDCRGRNGPEYTEPGAPGDRRHTCRFGFHANNWQGKGDTPPISATVVGTELHMERNSPRLVQHSKFMRRAWKANCDTSLIVEGNPTKIVCYIVGYLVKEGNATREYQAAFKSLVTGGTLDDTAKLVRKLLMLVLGHRDKPAQEVLYVATGQPLYTMSTPAGQIVSVSDMRRVLNCHLKLRSTVVDRYVKDCAGQRGITLYEFCAAQKPGFVSISGSRAEAHWPLSETFCRCTLMLHVPWTDPADLQRCSWDPQKQYHTFRQKFLRDFLYSEACPRLVFSQVVQAKLLADRPELRPRNHYSVKDAGKGTVAQFLKAFGNRSHDTDLNHDHVNCVSYPAAPPGYDWSDIANWQSHNSAVLDEEQILRLARFDEDAPNVQHDLQALDPLSYRTVDDQDQVAALGLVLSHMWQCFTDPVNATQLRLVMQGPGGAGKSYVVRVLRAAVQAMTGMPDSVMVLAPTGAAASVIAGETIHRGLAIGIDLEFLSGAKAAAAARGVHNVKLFVFDEMSMIDQGLLSKAERRISEFRSSSAGSWGDAWAVILCGDFYQLPPVCGLPLYAMARSPNSEQRRGQALYRAFDNAILLASNQRADAGDHNLRACLQALRNGDTASSVLQILNTRCIAGLSPEESPWFRQQTTMHFVAYNAERIEKNLSHLQHVQGPVAEFTSVDTGHKRHTHAPDSPTYFSGQQKILWLGRGVRVTLCRNIRTSLALTKGKCGTVEHVQYAIGTSPPSLPLFVLVRMDVDVTDTLKGQLSSAPEDSNVIPFVPRRVQCQSGCCSRLQIPLELCSGMTIHKSQGSTIVHPTVVALNSAAEQRWPGILYTALSRFSRLDMVGMEQPLHRDILLRASRGLDTSGRRHEQTRLQQLDVHTRTAHATLLTVPAVRQVVERCIEFSRQRRSI